MTTSYSAILVIKQPAKRKITTTYKIKEKITKTPKTLQNCVSILPFMFLVFLVYLCLSFNLNLDSYFSLKAYAMLLSRGNRYIPCVHGMHRFLTPPSNVTASQY